MPAKSWGDLVAFARRNSPFYAELYRDLPDDVKSLTDVPVIDQAAFWAANQWDDNRLLTGPLTDAGVYTSGGTTGAPKVSPWTRTEHFDSTSACGAGMVTAGLKPGQRVANLFFAGGLYGSFLYIEASLHNAPVENVRLPVGGHIDNAEIAELVANLGVNVLAGLPMKLAGVAEAVIEAGTRADTVELLLFAGDLLFDDVRPVLTNAFPHAKVSSLGYSTGDAGLVGTPVPGNDVRVHEPVADRTIVEILDVASDEPITEPGVRGRIVVTNLFRTLLPIIRYPVGDLAEWVDDECRRFRLVGRNHEGARVAYVAMPYADVHTALMAADPDHVMTGMQLIERRWDGKDGLILRLASTRGKPSAELDRHLLDAVYRSRPLYQATVDEGHVHPIEIEWVRTDGLATNARTGKVIQVLDERPHD
jgi:phenylacetate-coenzyme A ligase PaaK-like adenylate-forming protein